MKKKLKLTVLNGNSIERIEMEKLQNIRGGYVQPGTCENGLGSSCTNDDKYHETYKNV